MRERVCGLERLRSMRAGGDNGVCVEIETTTEGFA